MQKGELRDVWVVHEGQNPETGCLGVFTTSKMATAYLEWEVLARNPLGGARMTKMTGYVPDEGRVVLIRHVEFRTLTSDYRSDETRRDLALRRSAWDKLTPDERDALALKDPSR